MIIRIVKMKFQKDQVEPFKILFEKKQNHIRNFQGCHHLELLQDTCDASLFFTYSYWENEDFLNRYRQSAFFKETWTETRALFESKAEAWSVRSIARFENK